MPQPQKIPFFPGFISGCEAHFPFLSEDEKEWTRSALKERDPDTSGIYDLVFIFLRANDTPYIGQKACGLIRAIEMQALIRSMGHVTYENHEKEIVSIPDTKYDSIPRWMDIVMKENSMDAFLSLTRSVGQELRDEKDDKERIGRIIIEKLSRYVSVGDRTIYDIKNDERRLKAHGIVREPHISDVMCETMTKMATNYWGLYHGKNVRNACILNPYFSSTMLGVMEYLFGDFPEPMHAKIVEVQQAGRNIFILHEYKMSPEEQETHDIFAQLQARMVSGQD